MSANIEAREVLKKKEIEESKSGDYTFISLGDQSESEISWIKLHQMFDK